jgi:hypothetical protein
MPTKTMSTIVTVRDNSSKCLYASAMAKAVTFNNAAVVYFADGRFDLAWALFKGALEVKLVVERSTHDSGCIQNDRIVDGMFCINQYILKADDILQQHQHQHQKEPEANSRWIDSYGRRPMPPTRESSHNLMFYDLFVFARPFLIPNEYESRIDETADEVINKANSTSAIIIFNLAVVEHLVNGSSSKVSSLYELASSLLVGTPVDLLGIAIINNIGVWCCENDDADTSQRCMEHLSNILTACYDNGTRMHDNTAVVLSGLSSREYNYLLNNISSILSPPGSASAAA